MFEIFFSSIIILYIWIGHSEGILFDLPGNYTPAIYRRPKVFELFHSLIESEACPILQMFASLT